MKFILDFLRHQEPGSSDNNSQQGTPIALEVIQQTVGILMFTEVLAKASVQRLADILNTRYGVGLGVGFLAKVPRKPEDRHAPSRAEGALHIPLWRQDEYIATAIIKTSKALTAKEEFEIHELIHLILEPELYLSLLSEKGHRLETELTSTTENNRNDHPCESGDVYFLVGNNSRLIQKVSLEIHEISKRWAFLRFEDVKPKLGSITDLLALGEITLLIQDFRSLDERDLHTLITYIDLIDRRAGPLVLIAMDQPMDKLKGNLRAATNQIHLERLPTDTQRLRLALELILDPKAAMI